MKIIYAARIQLTEAQKRVFGSVWSKHGIPGAAMMAQPRAGQDDMLFAILDVGLTKAVKSALSKNKLPKAKG